MGNKKLWDITDQFRAVAAGMQSFCLALDIQSCCWSILTARLSSYILSITFTMLIWPVACNGSIVCLQLTQHRAASGHLGQGTFVHTVRIGGRS